MDRQMDCTLLNLFTPPLDEIATILEKGLAANFESVQVSVVDCPDLSTPPFRLAKPGLCGDEKVVDVGGPTYLLPLVDRNKLYNLRDVAKLADDHCGLLVGAGAGPWPAVGRNCELIANAVVDGPNVDVKSHIAKVNPETQLGESHEISTDQFALMANLYMCKGSRDGKVLEVKASKRTGELNYMNCIRQTLKSHYGEKVVGLGGTFLVEEGKAKLHVMSDFSSCPINTQDELNSWLKFYEYDGPITAVGYLVSHDPGMDLRVEHFHCFTDRGVGGHYHYDTSPDSVVYRGYFGVAKTLYRVDAPANGSDFGKD